MHIMELCQLDNADVYRVKPRSSFCELINEDLVKGRLLSDSRDSYCHISILKNIQCHRNFFLEIEIIFEFYIIR